MRASLIHVQNQAISNVRKVQASISLIAPSTRASVTKMLTDEAIANEKKMPTQGDIETYTEKQMASIKYEL
jgi:hypothetical protein